MLPELAEVLINIGKFGLQSEVEAEYSGHSLDHAGVRTTGAFTVTRMARGKSGRLILELTSLTDGKKIKVYPESVKKIDGMVPKRFAQFNFLRENGEAIHGWKDDKPIEPPKRGRKTNEYKRRMAELAVQQQQEE